MSRRPLNPFAQPYHPHLVYQPHQILIYLSPSYHYAPNLYYMPNQTSVTEPCLNMEASVDHNPSFVAPRPERNVGPRLKSSTTTTTCVWKKKNQALNFATASDHGTNTVAVESSASSSRRGGMRKRNGSPRRKVGPPSSRSNLDHGVKDSSFGNGKPSVIPFPEVSDGGNGREVTTLMIKNIPCKLSRRELLGILTHYCFDENLKSVLQSKPSKKLEFDFLYLPIDFKEYWEKNWISNLGYAFVNFTSSVAALKFYKKFHNSDWPVQQTKKKTCEVVYAKIQGKEALKNSLKRKVYGCHSSEYLPVVLDPPCDGVLSSRLLPIGTLSGEPQTG